MLFNSLQFAIFFPIVYCLYLVLNHKWQNRLLLVASCIFYGSWDWRFLCLMFTSISIDYICALKIYKSNDEKIRKSFLLLSIGVNLSFLGFFKYFNFFASNLHAILAGFGINAPPLLLNIMLPVGISFYTFEAITYVFDVYRRVSVPTTSFRDYALFVTYFPHLVAGPIMKAKNLLPQIQNKRTLTLENSYEGCYLVFWGLFQKIFIADNLAKIVNPLFASSPPYNGTHVLLAIYAFAFQIYCDFAGYSNMARGLGKLMGFDIMINFNLPYFSTNPREFWRRWHISLSTFLRDYLYISLGGSKHGDLMTYRNLAITMLLGGLWHGAAWTFVIWGGYQGALLIVHRLFQPALSKVPEPENIILKNVWFFILAALFFHLTCLGWFIFRSQSIGQICNMVGSIFFNFHITRGIGLKLLLFHVSLLLFIDYFCYKKRNLSVVLTWPTWSQALLYVVMFYLLIWGGAKGSHEFIYFQF